MTDYLDDDDDLETGSGQETNPFKELRAHAKKLEKDLKARDAELEELRSFRQQYQAEQREKAAAAEFEKLGLTAKQAKLYAKLNPDEDITEQAVVSFARDYGFIAEETPDPKNEADFKPVAIAGASPVKGTVSYEEYQAMLKTNPQAALQAVADGRVDGLMRTQGPPD